MVPGWHVPDIKRYVGKRAGALDAAVSRFLAASLAIRRQADATAVWLGIKAFIVMNLAMLAGAAPEFIYKAF